MPNQASRQTSLRERITRHQEFRQEVRIDYVRTELTFAMTLCHLARELKPAKASLCRNNAVTIYRSIDRALKLIQLDSYTAAEIAERMFALEQKLRELGEVV